MKLNKIDINTKINSLKEEIEWQSRMTKCADSLGKERAWATLENLGKELNELKALKNQKSPLLNRTTLIWLAFFAICGIAIWGGFRI
jgi:hypothetical protein